MKILRAIKLIGVAVALAAVVGACSTGATPTATEVPTIAPTVVVPATTAPVMSEVPSPS